MVPWAGTRSAYHELFGWWMFATSAALLVATSLTQTMRRAPRPLRLALAIPAALHPGWWMSTSGAAGCGEGRTAASINATCASLAVALAVYTWSRRPAGYPMGRAERWSWVLGGIAVWLSFVGTTVNGVVPFGDLLHPTFDAACRTIADVYPGLGQIARLWHPKLVLLFPLLGAAGAVVSIASTSRPPPGPDRLGEPRSLRMVIGAVVVILLAGSVLVLQRLVQYDEAIRFSEYAQCMDYVEKACGESKAYWDAEACVEESRGQCDG
jgi:hypothetical protein